MRRASFLLLAALWLIPTGGPALAQTAGCAGESFVDAGYAIDAQSAASIEDFLAQNMPPILERFPTFEYRSGERRQSVSYYDDSEQSLLRSRRELLHRLEHQLPNYREDREQVSYTDYATADQPPGETFAVRRYNNRTSVYDKHPLIGIVRRKERALLLERLDLPQERLLELSPKMVAEHRKKVFLISSIGEPVAQIALDHARIENFGLPVESRRLQFEKLPAATGRLKAGESHSLNLILCTLQTNITGSLGLGQPSAQPNYLVYESLATRALPMRPFILRHPLLFSLIQATVFALIGLLLIALIGKRYARGSHRVSKVRKNRNALLHP